MIYDLIMPEKHDSTDYCIEIKFQKGTKDPSRVFRSMTNLIEAFQKFDKSLISAIDNNIEPILILEDVEIGSIKTWLRSALEAIDDDAIKNIDWKPAIGKYLVKAKYYIVDFLNGKTSITNISEIKTIEDELLLLAQETDIKWLPIYNKVPPNKLLEGIKNISESLSYLSEGDEANFIIPDENKIGFNLAFQITPENIEDLLIKEEIISKSEMILKVKKPDFLGESMWDFKHGGRPFIAKIKDNNWLKDFQGGLVDVRPGDSLRAIVEITDKYDYNNELIGTERNIIKVIGVINYNPPIQTDLF